MGIAIASELSLRRKRQWRATRKMKMQKRRSIRRRPATIRRMSTTAYASRTTSTSGWSEKESSRSTTAGTMTPVREFALADWIELVADPGLGDEVPRVRRIGLELLAQLSHEHAQVLGLLLRGFAPHCLEQRAMAEHAIRMARHVHEQLELLRRQPHFVAAHVHAPGIDVDAEVADVERRDVVLIARADPAQVRPDAREQLVGAERL